MFIAIYKWRVKPALEKQFIDSWAEVTALYREMPGSLGSRLHKGSDGLWYGYAQWRSDEDRAAAFAKPPETPAREILRDAILETFVEIRLELVSDYLLPLE